MKSIDLEAWASRRYGPAARLVTIGDHLYDWRVDVRGNVHTIDVNAVARAQHGNGYRAAAVGAHLYDWRALRWADHDHQVFPVVLVASDLFGDIDGIRLAADRLTKAVAASQWWYGKTLGKTFNTAPALVVNTTHTTDTWNAISAQTATDYLRRALFDAGRLDFTSVMGTPPDSVRIVITPYAGDARDVWLGAMGEQNGTFAVIPQRATSVDVAANTPLDMRGRDVLYAISHELGHTFNLDHSCPDKAPADAPCQKSIMGTERGWDAILFPKERWKLLSNPFFTVTV